MSDVLVLAYHAVSASWPASLAVTPDALRSQLELLSRRGYRGATFTQALTDPPAERTLAVTFDDACRSVLELASPIMAALDVPGTVFAPTGFVDSERPMSWPGIEQWTGGPHEHELLPLSWGQLGELADRGWEIGSHTRSHPRLTTLDDATLATELHQSRSDCERQLERPCLSIAYPYGDVDERVAAAAREAGYAAGAALPSRFESRDRLRWPRVGIYYRDSPMRFRLKVSPQVRRLRTSGAWSGLARARRLARGRR